MTPPKMPVQVPKVPKMPNVLHVAPWEFFGHLQTAPAANCADFWPRCISEPAFMAWLARLVMTSQGSDPDKRLGEYIASTEPSLEWGEAFEFLAALKREGLD